MNITFSELIKVIIVSLGIVNTNSEELLPRIYLDSCVWVITIDITLIPE